MNFFKKFDNHTRTDREISTRRVPDGVMSLLAGLSVTMGVVVFLSNILAAKIWVWQWPTEINLPEVAQTFLVCGFTVKSPLFALREWIGPTIPFLGWTFTFDAGLLLFPVSFLVGDMIIEVYGKKTANAVLWMTAIVNIAAFLTIHLATYLPSYRGVQEVDFDTIFNASSTIVIGSSVSFALSRLVNNRLFEKYRQNEQGIFKWRALRSSFWGRLADTIVFNFIAYRGRFDDWELIRHMACAFGIGMILEYLLCELITSRVVGRICNHYYFADGKIML